MSALTDVFSDIATKIRSKLGVSTKYKPSEMADAIDSVYTAGAAGAKVGTATASDVLSGKTFTNSSTVGATGSMTNQGSKSFTITNTSSVTIPKGYYNGSGKITTSGMIVEPPPRLSPSSGCWQSGPSWSSSQRRTARCISTVAGPG